MASGRANAVATCVSSTVKASVATTNSSQLPLISVRGPDGWLLHAGDAYFFRGEMDLDEYRCTPMLRLYQQLMAAANRTRLANLERLCELKRHHARDIRLFCAHNAQELEEFQKMAGPLVPIFRRARQHCRKGRRASSSIEMTQGRGKR
jgi:hypothetical protein